MAINLMELVGRHLTPDLIGKMGNVVGESPSTITRAASSGVPAIMGAIAQRGSTEAGARGLIDSIHWGGYDTADPSQFGSMLEREDTRRSFLNRGQGILSSLFGGGTESTVSSFGNKLGLSSQASGGILAMLAPLVMSVIGRQVRAGNLSPAGLSTLLRGQTSYLTGAPPSTVHGAREVAITGGKHAGGSKNWLWALGLGALALIGAFFLFNRPKPEISTNVSEKPNIEGPTVPPPIGAGGGPQMAPPATPNVEEPQPEATDAAKPKAEEMGTAPEAKGGGPEAMGQETQAIDSYLSGKSDQNHFALKGLKFATARSDLSNEGEATVTRVATLLKRHPGSSLRVDGYTDDTGSPEQNQELSRARADSVKNELVNQGVDASRIQCAGHGADQPMASNDDDNGRAQNRRADLVFTK
jgi:outer membrane protein OmpA-like peptidoglycan-associated protein